MGFDSLRFIADDLVEEKKGLMNWMELRSD